MIIDTLPRAAREPLADREHDEVLERLRRRAAAPHRPGEMVNGER